MTYSRSNPSSRYTELQALYREMHAKGERFLGEPPEETFPGSSLPAQAARIKRLVELTGAQTLLDYGSGKGRQYDPHVVKDNAGGRWGSIMEYWGVRRIACYDPCYPPYSDLPAGRFDGVLSTDVLEHCPEQDVPWIVGEIFSYATRFVFASVACYPARKRLPTGENAHCTIKPVDWWRDVIEKAAATRPGLAWEVWFQAHINTANGKKFAECRIGNP